MKERVDGRRSRSVFSLFVRSLLDGCRDQFFGSAVTAVAMPVLVVQLLGATPFEVGVVNAAQFVPYALLGLIAGVYTDRWHRKPILVWASVGRALSLGAIPILWLAGVLQIWILVIALLLFGAFSVFGFAATQSLLPRLVPRVTTGSGQCAARSNRRRRSDSRTSDRRRTRRAAGSPCSDRRRRDQLPHRRCTQREHPGG